MPPVVLWVNVWQCCLLKINKKISYVTDPQTGTQTEVRTPYTESVVINAATIQAVWVHSSVSQGLDSPQEAAELALMLRAGALAAPMYFVEERVSVPALVRKILIRALSTQIGFLLVAIWMIVFFRLFGLIANFALVFNLAMILTSNVMDWCFPHPARYCGDRDHHWYGGRCQRPDL